MKVSKEVKELCAALCVADGVSGEAESAEVNGSSGSFSDVRMWVAEESFKFAYSRREFGALLSVYKAVISYGGWLAAVQVIAKAVGVNERTIRNILADYQRVSDVSSGVIAAMEAAGLDPAAKKNSKVVSILRVRDLEVADPVDAIAAAVIQAATPKAQYTIPGTVPVSKDERIIYKVRQAVRSSLSNVAPNRKLEILKQAIAEELYGAMGVTAAIVITPCVPALDLMGIKRTDKDSIGTDAGLIETEVVA